MAGTLALVGSFRWVMDNGDMNTDEDDVMGGS